MNFSKKLKFAFAFSAFSLSFLTAASPAKNDLKKTFFTLDDGESISTVMAAPINITNNTSVTSTFSVMLLNDVLDGGLTGTTINDDHVSKTWIVQSSSATTSGSGIDLELTWDASDEVGMPSSYDVVVYNEQQNSWARLNGNLGSVQTSGSTKTLSITGVTEDFTSPLLLAVAPAPNDPAPVLSSLSTYTGEIGDQIILTGTNFASTSSANKVFFGGVKATVVSSSTTQITVEVPACNSTPEVYVLNKSTEKSSNKKPFVLEHTSSGSLSFGWNADNYKQEVTESASIKAGSYNVGLNWELSDMNDDGLADFVFIQSNNTVQIVYNPGRNSNFTLSNATTATVTPSTASNISDMVVADFNNDGLMDVAIAQNILNNGHGIAEVFKNNGNNTFSSYAIINFSNLSYYGGWIPNNSQLLRLDVGDVDLDGYLDIMAFSQTQYVYSAFAVWRQTAIGSSGTFSNYFQPASTGNNYPVRLGGFADFNNDGYLDAYTDAGGTLKYYLGGASGFNTTEYSLSYDGSYAMDQGLCTDINGDGQYDNLFAGSSSVSNIYFNGSSITLSQLTTNQKEYVDLIDNDADGNLDFVASGGWHGGTGLIGSQYNGTSYQAKTDFSNTTTDYGKSFLIDLDGDNYLDVIAPYISGSSITYSIFQGDISPSISVSGSLVMFEKCQNTASTDQSLTLTGSNLTANVSVPSNSNLEYSIDGGSTWNASLTIAPTSGIVSETLLVRAKSAVNSDVSTTSFSISSTGATSVAVSYEIDVLTPPAVANATISTPSGTAISYTPTVTNGVSNAMYTWTVASANSNVTGEVANSTPSYTFDATLTSTQLFKNKLLTQ
jgi:hypothetical protein